MVVDITIRIYDGIVSSRQKTIHQEETKYVAAELLHTVIGSFGLVTAALFTVLCAGMFLAKR